MQIHPLSCSCSIVVQMLRHTVHGAYASVELDNRSNYRQATSEACMYEYVSFPFGSVTLKSLTLAVNGRME